MHQLKLTINSDRPFQRELQAELHQLDPNLKPEIIIRKSFDALQVTGLVIASADLLVNVLNLLITLKGKSPDYQFRMRLEADGKTLEIDSDRKIDAKEIVRQFFNNDKQ